MKVQRCILYRKSEYNGKCERRKKSKTFEIINRKKF